jgi:predicted phage-related endonuclease
MAQKYVKSFNMRNGNRNYWGYRGCFSTRFFLAFSKNSIIFAAVIKIYKTMALPIKPPPTLTGKAAEEFYERAANMKETKTKEEVQESMRKTLAFLAEQELTNPYQQWKLI